MKPFSKILTGAAAAALVTLTAASPAQAQWRDRDRDDGIDVGDVITGVAIVGGIAAAASAIGNIGRGYDPNYGRGYDPSYGRGYDRGYDRFGYNYNRGYGEQAAVQACGYQAERYGQGRVQITQVDRRSSSKYRVRGVMDGGYDTRSRGFGGYRGQDSYGSQVGFKCDVRADGRVTDFDLDRRYAGRW
jgi:hypothetical protein